MGKWCFKSFYRWILYPYKNFSKKQIGLVDLGSRGNVGFFIIYGAKEKDDPSTEKCEKCSKNPQSGKTGENGWNFCAECLKHPTANKDNNSDCVKCYECRKILLWHYYEPKRMGLPMPFTYDEKYKWEWENKTAVQRWKKIKENKNADPADSFCSDDCRTKNEKKQEEQRPFCIR